MERKNAIAAEIPRLRRYARALLGGDAEADDLVQDCLERAIGRIEQWRDGESPRKWLFSILHNIYVDGVRRQVRRPAHVGLDKLGPAQSTPAASVGVARDLEAALHQLPTEQRQCVLLIGLEGLSYAQTAEILGVPVGTVMSRLARGRDRLRNLMDGDGVGGGKPVLRRVK
jgi:RNA polymerase sigma-70 factor (ECF subfamily)